MESAAKRFFGASHYGVVGANSDPNRFGYKGPSERHRSAGLELSETTMQRWTDSPALSPSLRPVFAWYLQRGIPVTPVTPSAAQVTVGAESFATIATVGELPHERVSLSLITPPPVTARILGEASKAGVWGVWLQPGTYDESTLKLLQEDDWWEGRWVAGEDGASRGHGGWCVLVDGDRVHNAAAQGETHGRL